MASRIHVAVGVLIDSRGCLLLTRRLKGTHLAGYWEFPGGKVEPGETREAALARELWEELELRIEAPAFLGTVQGHRDGGQPFALHGYAVIVPLGAPALRVHDRAFWVQRARWSAEALLPADRALFALLPPSPAVAPLP